MTTGRQEVRVALGTHSRDELMSSRETAEKGAVHKLANKTKHSNTSQNVPLNRRRLGEEVSP